MIRRLSAVFAIAISACAQDRADRAEAPSTATSSAATTSAAKPTSAAEATLRAGGRWSFSLDDSPAVAAKVRAQCSTEPSPDACYAKIRAAGALESVGFGEENDQLVWTSYDEDGSVLRKVPLRIVRATADDVVVIPAGPEEGKQLPRIPADAQITVTVRADGVVTMSDVERGLLAFCPMK
jgi:hypothetical protein